MLLTIIVFLFVLSLLILAHETGHFLMAKKVGIKVEEFGFGYPPRIISKKIGETVYSINWLLFGGFVKLLGEELNDDKKIENSEKKRSFWGKSKKARVIVCVAGVLANFILAIICFSIVYSFIGIPRKTNQVRVIEIRENSPAAQAGILKDDIVLAIDDVPLKSVEKFIEIVEQNRGKEIILKIKREQNNPCKEKILGGLGFSCERDNLLLFVTPREKSPEGEGALGVVISDIEMKKYPFWQMPFYGTIEGFKEAFTWTKLVVAGIGEMFKNLLIRGQIPKEVAGPLGILQITSGVAKSGFLTILQFVGVLSVNLAVINILPFPALDGGRLIFIGYELIMRKKPKPKIEHLVNYIGMAFLLFLIILVTINDVIRLIQTTPILSQLKSLFSF